MRGLEVYFPGVLVLQYFSNPVLARYVIALSFSGVPNPSHTYTDDASVYIEPISGN